jgi:CRISPR type I-E-associated protein CasB/Cse2
VSIESLVGSLTRLVDPGEDATANTPRSRAALAQLRRAALSTRGAVSAYRHVAQHVPEAESPDDYLLIGSLFAINPRHVQDPKRDLGAVCAATGVQEEGKVSPAAERRFAAMLSADRADLAPHLRRVVTMADRAGLAIDYVRLFWDLRKWRRAGTRSAQLGWARSFYASVKVDATDGQASGENDVEEES